MRNIEIQKHCVSLPPSRKAKKGLGNRSSGSPAAADCSGAAFDPKQTTPEITGAWSTTDTDESPPTPQSDAEHPRRQLLVEDLPAFFGGIARARPMTGDGVCTFLNRRSKNTVPVVAQRLPNLGENDPFHYLSRIWNEKRASRKVRPRHHLA